MIEYFEFDHHMEKQVSELSSGNQRKLCILISLLRNPKIFLYDEATCGVDLIVRMKMKKLFQNFKQRRNSLGLFTTHFLKDIDIFCDRLVIISDGKIKYVSDIDKMKNLIGGYVITLYYLQQEGSSLSNQEQMLENFSEELKAICNVTLKKLNKSPFKEFEFILYVKEIRDYSEIMKKLQQGQ